MLDAVGQLLVEAPLQAGRPAHVSSASGLVAHAERLFVVADDEPVLGVFDQGGGPGRLMALEPSALPLDHAARKAAKPDLESLALLPPARAWPDGALLTLGSGATERRERGWLVALGPGGDRQAAQEVSLTRLYEHLRAALPDLNIEGAAVHDGALWLAQRGNGAQGVNALIELDLTQAVSALADDSALTPKALRGLKRWELGAVGDVPLTFSDLAPAAGGMLFCAVAEAVASTYDDGACVGAGVGALDPRSGAIKWFMRLREPHKVEGVATSGADLLLVADPDHAQTPAPLFRLASERLPA